MSASGSASASAASHLPASAYNFHLHAASSSNLSATTSAAASSYSVTNPTSRSTTPVSQVTLSSSSRQLLYPQSQSQSQSQLQPQPQPQPYQPYYDSSVPVSRTVYSSSFSHPTNKPAQILDSAPHISSALNYPPILPQATFSPASLPRTSSLLPPPRITVNETRSWKQPPLLDPFHASPPWADPVNDRDHDENVSPKNTRRRSSKTHSRSSSLGGLSDSFRNLNRWSISTASSRASNATPATKNRFSRRMSIDSTALFSHSNQPTSPRRLQKGRPTTASSSTDERTSSIPPLASLPPILPLPSLEPDDFARATLSRAESRVHDSSAGGRLGDDSLAAHDISYFSASARATPEPTPLPSSAFGSRDAATMAHPESASPTFVRGHQRSRSQGLKSSTDSASSPKSRDRKPPSQKAMLSKALQKANTAVQLDNAQNFDGARVAYYEACDLLQQVLDRTPGDDDKKKLEAIVSLLSSLFSSILLLLLLLLTIATNLDRPLFTY